MQHRMKVRARFGPLPKDLHVEIGEDGFDITQALCRIAVVQGLTAEEQRAGQQGHGAFLPRVELELSIPYVEIEGEDVRVDVFITDPVREALIRLGWLPPAGPFTVPMQDRVADIVSAAYAYVDLPEDVAHDPELEDEHPGQVAYQHLAGTVERHRALCREMQA